MTLRRAVIVDIDGTLALRQEPGRSPYDWDRVGEDLPNPPAIELVQTIAAAGQHTIILMSGRDEVCRWQTEMWLAAHRVPWAELHMRPHKNNEKDSMIKERLYRDCIEGVYEVAFVVDDRRTVVNMWRSIGLTVLQCADGDF